MRHREPTPTEALAIAADLLALHDTERGLLCLPDEPSIEALIAAAEDRDAVIISIEGFEVLPDEVRPAMDAIIDLSSCSDAGRFPERGSNGAA